MARITFAPSKATRRKNCVILRDAHRSTLTLRLVDEDCAAIVAAALQQNSKSQPGRTA